jgi:hypothetical protein
MNKNVFRITQNKMKRGRPKLPPNETKSVFTLRFSNDELTALQRAASRSAMKLRAWATKLLLDAAERDKS